MFKLSSNQQHILFMEISIVNSGMNDLRYKWYLQILLKLHEPLDPEQCQKSKKKLKTVLRYTVLDFPLH